MYSMSFGMFGKDDQARSTKGFGAVSPPTTQGLDQWLRRCDRVRRLRSGQAPFGRPISACDHECTGGSGGRVFVSSQDNHSTRWRRRWAASSGIIRASRNPRASWESTSAAVAGNSQSRLTPRRTLMAARADGRSSWNDMLTSSGNVTALQARRYRGRPVVDRDIVFAISHSGLMAAIAFRPATGCGRATSAASRRRGCRRLRVRRHSTDQRLLCLTRKEGRVKWVHQLQRWTDKDKSDFVVWAGRFWCPTGYPGFVAGYAVSVSPYTGQVSAAWKSRLQPISHPSLPTIRCISGPTTRSWLRIGSNAMALTLRHCRPAQCGQVDAFQPHRGPQARAGPRHARCHARLGAMSRSRSDRSPSG